MLEEMLFGIHSLLALKDTHLQIVDDAVVGEELRVLKMHAYNSIICMLPVPPA